MRAGAPPIAALRSSECSSFTDASLSDVPTGDAFPPSPVGSGQVTDGQAAGFATGFSHAPKGSAPSPCLTEPTLGSMFPTNFTPPLFDWTADPMLAVFELHLHVDGEKNDLIVYSDQTSFQMSATSWAHLTTRWPGHDIQVSLRAATVNGGRVTSVVSGPSGVIHIAPVAAPGAVVYWATSETGALKGFRIGDPSATTVLTPTLIQQSTPSKSATCIGCHVSSPDGLVVFLDVQQSTHGPFGVDARLVDGTGSLPATSVVSSPALSTLSLTYDVFPTLSPAHYSPTDAVVVSVRDVDSNGAMYDASGSYELVWTDLHSGASGTLQRNGDPGQADSPSFSHDGLRVAYTSTTSGPISIYESSAATDIYTVAYADRAGGAATPLEGASDPAYNEYFPAFSPEDSLVAFNRIDTQKSVYGSPNAEVFVVPAAGGTPIRAVANDPPQCAGTPSPGIRNSWPRWAPSSGQVGSKRYYWLVFSSSRRSDPTATTPIEQLFLCAIVTTLKGSTEVIDSTYPAVYIPSQTSTESNRTPAWDQFQVPPPPPPR